MANVLQRAKSRNKKQVERCVAPKRGEQLRCPICERKFERHARQQIYCSARCKDKGRVRSRKALLAKDTGAPAHPPKIVSENNNLRRAKIESSLFANAPLNILGGGSWRWPNTPQIDGKTWAKVVRAEVGDAA
jgi:hypothetical protein